MIDERRSLRRRRRRRPGYVRAWRSASPARKRPALFWVTLASARPPVKRSRGDRDDDDDGAAVVCSLCRRSSPPPSLTDESSPRDSCGLTRSSWRLRQHSRRLPRGVAEAAHFSLPSCLLGVRRFTSFQSFSLIDRVALSFFALMGRAYSKTSHPYLQFTEN